MIITICTDELATKLSNIITMAKVYDPSEAENFRLMAVNASEAIALVVPDFDTKAFLTKCETAS